MIEFGCPMIAILFEIKLDPSKLMEEDSHGKMLLHGFIEMLLEASPDESHDAVLAVVHVAQEAMGAIDARTSLPLFDFVSKGDVNLIHTILLENPAALQNLIVRNHYEGKLPKLKKKKKELEQHITEIEQEIQ